jgi:S-adenosyl methyltransferase
MAAMDIDITTPHLCRIYDYVLGGSHNHEADRRAAEAMMALLPAYPRWARENRAFQGRLGRGWAAEGRTRVLDLGSSLPTQGHFNACMPGAKILFSDIDPLTVAQAQQILAYSPDMAYVEADVREPERLLAHAEAFFGDERVLGVGFIGIVPFLSDDQVRRLLGALHGFCAPGSTLAVTFPSVRDEVSSDDLKETLREMCRIARVDFFHRTPEQIAALLAPWRVTESRPLWRWLSQEEHRAHDEHPMDRLMLHGTLAERD